MVTLPHPWTVIMGSDGAGGPLRRVERCSLSASGEAMRTLIAVSLTVLFATALAAQDRPTERLDVTKLPGSAPAPSVLKQGGTFIWGRSADAIKLDPAVVTDSESVIVITNIFDTLVSFKPGSTEIVPWLSDRWTTSVDQLVWTFHLREDVKFHDGTPLNAEAVVFSFERQMDKKHPARRAADVFPFFQDNFKTLKNVEAGGEFKVRFTLSQAYAPFLSALALFSCGIVSPTAWKSEGKDADGRYKYNFSIRPVGTGPFVFKSWKKDSRIVLEANKEHFSGPPPIDKLIFKPIAAPHARLKELEAGGIHGMDNPALEDLEFIHANKRLRIVSRPGINVCYLAMNTLKKPFRDIRVRQAVAYAIDKKRLITAAYDGLAEPAVTMCPKGLNGHLDKAERRLDLKRARGLLEEVGYRDGFDVMLMYSGTRRTYLPDPETTAIRIQQDLKQIGITVTLDKPYPMTSKARYIGDFKYLPGPRGLFLTKPPYGRITAIDLTSGEHKWMVPVGEGPRNHPAVKDLNLPPLGWPSRIHVLLTKSLLFAGQQGVRKGDRPSRRGFAVEFDSAILDPTLRAYNKTNGELVVEIDLPANVTAAPMTYMVDGQQYIVVAVGGSNVPAELVALRLR